jgi:hypothetical protein
MLQVHVIFSICNKNLTYIFWQSRLPCTGCGTSCNEIASTSGTLTDGSGLSSYSNNSLCQWILAPPGATYITISFILFETNYLMDYVRLYNCSDSLCASKQVLYELSGSYSTLSSISLPVHYMLVEFTSGTSSTVKDGFSARWTSSVWTFVSSSSHHGNMIGLGKSLHHLKGSIISSTFFCLAGVPELH